MGLVSTTSPYSVSNNIHYPIPYYPKNKTQHNSVTIMSHAYHYPIIQIQNHSNPIPISFFCKVKTIISQYLRKWKQTKKEKTKEAILHRILIESKNYQYKHKICNIERKKKNCFFLSFSLISFLDSESMELQQSVNTETDINYEEETI